MTQTNHSSLKARVQQLLCELAIMADKTYLGSRHTMHQWGPFRVEYRDGTRSRRQSWQAAKALASNYGGHITHINSGAPVSLNHQNHQRVSHFSAA